MRDSVVLRRRRDLGELIADSFSLFFANWPSLAAVVAPAALLSIALALVDVIIESETLAFLWLAVSLFLGVVAQELVAAAGIVLLNERASGKTLSAGDALDAAQARAGDVVGAALRSAAIAFALAVTVIGLPFAAYRIVRWSLVVQSVMLDDLKGEPSLAHSAGLVEGVWWVTFGRLAVSYLVLGLPLFLFSLAVTSAVPGVAGIFVSGLTGFIGPPFIIVAKTLIFFDLKMRRDEAPAATNL